MKFLCVECDAQMTFQDRRVPGDGTMAAVFRCPECGRATALLTNPMETQLVSSLGVKVGGRTVPEQPLEHVRSSLRGGREAAFDENPAVDAASAGPVRWSVEAVERLDRVPRFVRGMVKRIYADWAKEHGIREMTPEVMDRARRELGLEGM
jgi:hypothetical protein